jgi:hypothetical protein
MGVHVDRGDLRKGKKKDRPKSVVSPFKWEAVYLNKK